MIDKQKTTNAFIKIAYFAFIISISVIPALSFIKYIRLNKTHLYRVVGNTTPFTDVEGILMIGSAIILVGLLPILLIQITNFTKKYIYFLMGILLTLTFSVIGLLQNTEYTITNLIAFLIYLIFCIVVGIISESIIVIYKWLWTTEVELKGKRIVLKKKLDVKKLALTWTVLATIIGLLLGIKK